MPIRVANIRLGVDEPEQALPQRMAIALDLRPDEIGPWRILRKSLDARDKSRLKFVYAVEVTLPLDERRVVEQASKRRRAETAELYAEPPFEFPLLGREPLAERPVVVGAGPAGLLAALFLAEHGYRPVVLERGRPVRDRIRDVAAFDAGGPHDPESNYLFGEGGAGTFSDGKLTCRVSGPDVRRVLEVFAECKGKPSILYDYRPHLGSNRLPAVVKALRQRIEGLGGTFHFSCRLEDLDLTDGRLRGAQTSSGHFTTQALVLAIGHSARDTYQMLFERGVPMTQKPFQLGVRIEQPQEAVNRAQYGPSQLEEKLGAADYSLVSRGHPNVFTFCMCAGGYVMPSVSEPGYFSTNGMSLASRASTWANSGLMVTVEPSALASPHVLAGMWLQRRYEQQAFEAGRGEYLCPIQRADDFLRDRATTGAPASSYQRGVVPARIAELVPPEVVAALRQALPTFDARWQGRFLRDATLVGPEARGSSPLRISRDPVTLESPAVSGLYPVGEGAGYAGGIVSAALDGLRAAKAIAARFAPLEAK